MRVIRRLPVLALLCLAPLALGCRGIESNEELQTLASEMPREERAGEQSPASAGSAAASDERLDRFPLGGSVFPGVGGRLHSSLCDPALDARNACI